MSHVDSTTLTNIAFIMNNLEKLNSDISLYQSLIFDMDGTLINSEIKHHEAWNHMLEAFGFKRLGSDVFYSFASTAFQKF